MFLLSVIIVSTVLFVIIGVYQKKTNGICKSKKRLDGKVTIVTGGTSGMGLEISKDFARRGARVIIACPFEDEGLKALKEIIKETGNENVEFKLLDLAATNSVRNFAADILENETRIDILINNAGVGVPVNKGSYNSTNFIMHVNYFGHYLLTLLLLPLLIKTGTNTEPCRIVNTSSSFHIFGILDHRWLDRNDIIYRLRCYGNSKYCLLLFGHELSKKIEGTNVVVNAVDPGFVGTAIWSSWHSIGGFLLAILLNLLTKTPWEGAQTALHVALDEETAKVSGKFFVNCKLSRAKKSAYDDTLSQKLWKESIKIVRLEKEDLQQCFGVISRNNHVM